MGVAKPELLNNADESRVIAAIAEAEKQTSGEIRVHLEARLKGDAMERAKKVFEMLGMAKTKEKNGVLVYVAVENHILVILGDSGIYNKVPHDFWAETRNIMLEQFKNGLYADGLCLGIAQAGVQLSKFFPRRHDDQNELSNTISFG